MMINEKLPPSFLQAATPRSVNSQRDPPNRSTGGRLLLIAAHLGTISPRSAHFQLVPRLHTLMIVIRQRRAWNHVVEAVLGLGNCPRRLGRSHLRTATKSGLASTFASSASSPGRWLGTAAACSPSTTLEPVSAQWALLTTMITLCID